MPISLIDLLQRVLDHAKGQSMSLKEIFVILKHRGLAILVVIFTAPFLFPFQIPGISIPFGIANMFLGMQIALPKRKVFPEWILKKEFAYPTLEKWIKRTQWVIEKVNKMVYHRLPYFVKKPWVVHLNGWLIFFLSSIFVMPIPLPFSNFLCAIPLFLISLGMLEEDGLLILLGYIFAILGVAGVIAIIWLGVEGFTLI